MVSSNLLTGRGGLGRGPAFVQPLRRHDRGTRISCTASGDVVGDLGCDDATVVAVIWELRNPDGGSTGLEVARARMEHHEHVLGHALPERVDVDVTDEGGT